MNAAESEIYAHGFKRLDSCYSPDIGDGHYHDWLAVFRDINKEELDAFITSHPYGNRADAGWVTSTKTAQRPIYESLRDYASQLVPINGDWNGPFKVRRDYHFWRECGRCTCCHGKLEPERADKTRCAHCSALDNERARRYRSRLRNKDGSPSTGATQKCVTAQRTGSGDLCG